MIYIVRHGQTNWNLEKRNQGRKDIELNEKGILQAKETAEKLKGKTFDIVYSSPLKRAMQTAKIITNQEIIEDSRIIERSNGELEGKLKSEYQSLVDFTDPNETRDFRKKIENFFKEIVNKYPKKDILVVTHAGVSIYAKCYFEGEPIDGNYSKYKLKNCEILKYEN